MSLFKRKDGKEQREQIDSSNMSPEKDKSTIDPEIFRLNRDIYYQYLAEIQNFSPTLTEIAIIHRIRTFFNSFFPCTQKELLYILIYAFKKFRKIQHVSIPKLMNVSRNERFSWIESITKHLSKVFCEIFLSGQENSGNTYITKKVQNYFTRYS
ncbi:MAG: hypothetical protein K9W44_07020 [Candidatus Lokiarchaeota archaeon]|nr:hypothetical protein [Candidatus Harpocratesius repetitus]